MLGSQHSRSVDSHVHGLQTNSLSYSAAYLPPMKSQVPAYVSFDKKVLRFFAYFQEAVAESSVGHKVLLVEARSEMGDRQT